MKPNTILIISLFSVFILIQASCKKQSLNDVIPVVKIASVLKLGTDSVIVTGEITSNNGDSAVYEGFCYGTDPVPALTERQKLYTSSKTTFSAHLFVDKDSTYYFRCFATNSFGYAVSSPVKE